MKRLNLFYGLFFNLCSINLPAQWVQMEGPYAGAVLSITSTTSTVWIGTNDIVFRSDDNGGYWAPVYGPGQYITSLAIINEKIFAASYIGIRVSYDNGISWKDTGVYNKPAYSLAIKESRLYAGTNDGVYTLNYNGETWIATNIGLKNAIVYALAMSNDILFAGTNDGVFIYDGSTWSSMNDGLSNTQVRSITQSSTFIYVGTNGGGVFRSPINSKKWTAINNGLSRYKIISLIVKGTVLYAGTENGVFSSSNEGNDWVYAGLENRIFALAAIHHYLFAGSVKNIYRSEDNGLTWSAMNKGLVELSIRTLSIQGPYLFAGTGRGLFRSDDEGKKWIDISTADPAMTKMMTSGPNLFACERNTLYLSTNQGENWTKIENVYVDFLAVFSPIIYGFGWGAIYRSVDNGANWANFGPGLHYGIYGVVSSDSSLYAGTDGGLFYLHKDLGWTHVDNDTIKWDISDLVKIGPYMFIAKSGRIYRSNDNGHSCIEMGNGLVDTFVRRFYVKDSVLFAGGTGNIYLSKDHGNHWIAVNQGLQEDDILCFASDDKYLYIGSYDGIWCRPLSEMITAVDEKALPVANGFMLKQNYPNPFNPSTSISFHLPLRSFVSLKIFDRSGRQVAVLVSEELPAGNHAYEWHAAGLPSGIYFYQLLIGSHIVATKKLTLIK